MYARNQHYKYNKEPVTGGQPITVEQAKVSEKQTYHTKRNKRLIFYFKNKLIIILHKYKIEIVDVLLKK